jgi:hypothetical protein
MAMHSHALHCKIHTTNMQILLTFDAELVPSVASLLEVVLRHNEERLCRLYSKGVCM